MLRQRVPSAIVMTLGLLLIMSLDQWLAMQNRPTTETTTVGWELLTSPGTVMLLGLLVPAAWLASRELGVLLHAVGIGTGPKKRWVFTGALAGLAVGVWPSVVMTLAVRTDWAGDPQLLLMGGLGMIAVFLGWGLLLSMRREQSPRNAIHAVVAMGFGFVFLGLLMSSWYWAHRWLDPMGLACAVMVIKSCDIGAYFTGRFLGRRKLIVWLSPGKTWEGLIGGTTLAALVCLVLEPVLTGSLERVVFDASGQPMVNTDVESFATEGLFQSVGISWPWWYCLLAGALLGYVGQLGDLFASALKRDAGVKDFARTIPGFGGVMDVIDSLLLAGPVVLGLVWLGWWFG